MTAVAAETWHALARPEHAALVAAAAGADPQSVSAVGRLRKLGAIEMVRAALHLAEARRKAAGKFGDSAAALWADPEGVEMASSLLAARHKAERMVRVLGNAEALDICCGIGGDAMAMHAARLRVRCVDLNPARAWMAGLNSGCEATVGDAADTGIIGPGTRLVHIDPSRRTGEGHASRRIFRLADLLPGPPVLRAIIDRVAGVAGTEPWGAAIKLGPGVNAAELAVIAGKHPLELEIISERGRLTQGIAWIGAMAVHERSATLLDADGPGLATHMLVGTPDRPPPVGPMGRFVFEPDDSVERAGLLAELCTRLNARMPHAAAGLLTTDTLVVHPMLAGFEVLDVGPWNPRRVREVLGGLDAGIIEVKARGGVVDPDRVQTELRGGGSVTLTVFVVRFGDQIRAIVSRRLKRAA